MSQTDPFANGTPWQHVLTASKQLLQHLHTAVDSTLGGPGVSHKLLDPQIALLRQALATIEAQLSSLDTHGEMQAGVYEWEQVLGQLCFPPVGRVGIRQFHKQTLLAYAAMLRGYLALLEDTPGRTEESPPPPPRQGKVPIT